MLLEEMTRRDELLMMISDMSKDITGIRSSDKYLCNTDDELEQIFEDLQVQVVASIEAEVTMKNSAAAKFEKQLSDLISSGAGNRATAIRWLRDAFEDAQMSEDDGYFEYTMNLPYGYLKGK